MSTPDFFRSRLDQMIDLRHPLAVLAPRLPWASIEAAVAPKLAHATKPARRVAGVDLAGAFDGEFGGGISPAGRPRLPVRLMVSLLYLRLMIRNRPHRRKAPIDACSGMQTKRSTPATLGCLGGAALESEKTS